MNSTLYRIVLCLMLVFALRGHMNACWETEPQPDRLRASLFHVCLKSMKPLLPFDYSYNESSWKTLSDIDANDRWRNVAEWNSELASTKANLNPVSQDVFAVLYQMSPEDFSAQVAVGSRNTFIHALMHPSNRKYLDYIVLAKRMESSTSVDPWDYVSPSSPIIDHNDLKARILDGANHQDSKFLRDRYRYQYVRLLHMVGSYHELVEVTKQIDKALEKSVVYGWQQMYRAIACSAVGDSIGANIACAESFRHGDEKKIRVMRLFYRDAGVVDASLRSTLSKENKIALLTMSAILTVGPAQSRLEQILRLSKRSVNSPSFMFLVRREVKKLEDRVLTAQLYGRPAIDVVDANANARGRLRRFLSFLESTIPVSKGEYKSVLLMAEVHLLFLDKQWTKASALLTYLERRSFQDTTIQRQVLIERLYHTATTASAKRILVSRATTDGIKTLEKLAQTDWEFSGKALQGILELMSIKLLRSHDIASGALCYAKALSALNTDLDDIDENDGTDVDTLNATVYPSECDRIVASILDEAEDPEAVENLLFLLRIKREKSHGLPVLTKHLLQQNIRSTSIYYELLARIYARQHDWKNVLHIYTRAAQEGHRTMSRDPFVPPSWPHKHIRSAKYEWVDFVKSMEYLQSRVKKNIAGIQERLRYAHGLLNASYYGHAWIVLKGSHSVRDGIGIRRYRDEAAKGQIRYINENGTRFAMFANRPSDKNYYLVSDARREYEYVYDHAHDRETKAKALYFMHYCDFSRAKTFEKARESAYDWWHTTDVSDLTHFQFKRLREFYSRYSDTKTFAALNCPTLASFISTTN